MRCAALVLVACGSASAPPKPAAVQPPPRAREASVDPVARRDELATAHRKLEAEQQDALALTCTEHPPREPHERCLPSCYPTESPDWRAGQRVAGIAEIRHLVCDAAVPILADEIDGKKLVLRHLNHWTNPRHRKTTWQGAFEAQLLEHHVVPVARGDDVVVIGDWRRVVHPVTHQALKCVTVAHVTRAMHRPIDGCGADGSLGCEANGDAAARGINVVHYRLEEARRLSDAGKTAECQQAALEAIAVARGLPRWRQYAKLNVDRWHAYAAYRTRFDGTLDEDTLFTTATELGAEAETIYTGCGGVAGAPTTPANEQSFHACW